MKILAFDTSQNISIAVYNDEFLLAENQYQGNSSQSELLIPLIEKTMKEANLQYFDLDLITTNSGPSSFTGSRIAISVLKTMRIATNIPVVLSNVFELLTFKHYQTNQQAVMVTIADNNKQIFYTLATNKIDILKHQLLDLSKLNEIIVNKNIVICGTAKYQIQDILKQQNYDIKLSDNDEIDASLLANLAKNKMNNRDKSQEFAFDNLNPVYLTDPKIGIRKK